MRRIIPLNSWVVASLVIFMASAVPRHAEAQSSQWYADWTCSGSQCATVMGGSSGTAGPFSSSPECETWRQTYITSSRCRSGGSATSAPVHISTGGWVVYGGLGGAMLGSFWKGADSTAFAAGGAAIGVAAVGGLALLGKAKEMSTPAVIAYAAIVGASAGAAKGLYDKSKIPANSTPVPGAKDPNAEIGKDAAIGAGAAVTVFLMEKLAVGSEYRFMPSLSRAMSHVRISGAARRIGLGW